MSLKIRHTIRATRQYSKIYIDKLCAQFAPLYVANIARHTGRDDLEYIDFAKQDVRGAPSITITDSKHCVPFQKFFATYGEMLTYMHGYVDASTKKHY